MLGLITMADATAPSMTHSSNSAAAMMSNGPIILGARAGGTADAAVSIRSNISRRLNQSEPTPAFSAAYCVGQYVMRVRRLAGSKSSLLPQKSHVH